jgi:hypothetical protein
MDGDWRKRIVLVMIVGAVLVGARTAYIFHERSKPFDIPKPKTVPLTDDDYVRPQLIFPYDMKTANKELAGKTVWVRSGNAVAYFHYREANHSVEFANSAGLLPPLDKLEIEEVILARAPVRLAPGQVAVVRQQVMAIFREAGHPGLFAVSIGNVVGDDFNFTVNDLFFYEDPHGLYRHWPPEVWSAIDSHRVEKGMSELEVSFALGNMVAAGTGDYGNRLGEYRSGGQLVTVTFEKDRVTEIVTGPP